MDECDSRGELGDMGDCIVAGGGAENQDQEARAQRCRRKHGVRSARTRATTSARSVRYYYTRNIYIYYVRPAASKLLPRTPYYRKVT